MYLTPGYLRYLKAVLFNGSKIEWYVHVTNTDRYTLRQHIACPPELMAQYKANKTEWNQIFALLLLAEKGIDLGADTCYVKISHT